MREQWKSQDRPCPPCRDCGEELYEQFWGNGGWTKVEKATEAPHDERQCIARLKTAAAHVSDTHRQSAREFLFEWLGVDHRNDCRGSSIDSRTGQCDACKRRVQPPLAMVDALAGLLDAVEKGEHVSRATTEKSA
jgi:hypothetical protein